MISRLSGRLELALDLMPVMLPRWSLKSRTTSIYDIFTTITNDLVGRVSVFLVSFSSDHVHKRGYCTVLGHKSEQNPYGTLPRILPNFCPMTVAFWRGTMFR
jgi:hypothetical protein